MGWAPAHPEFEADGESPPVLLSPVPVLHSQDAGITTRRCPRQRHRRLRSVSGAL